MGKKGIKITADPTLVNFHFTNTPSTSSTGPQQPYQHHGAGSSSTSLTRPRSGSFNTTTTNNNNTNRHNHHHKKNHPYRTAEDRASSRKKISTHMFPLHSSPDHAFVISRCGGGSAMAQPSSTITHETNIHGTTPNTFQGPDRPVSWESVRIVKCFTPIAANSMDDKTTTTTTTNNTNATTNNSEHVNDNEGTTTAISSCPAYIPCPICLDDNCACPRITKCGHTFCYTCILYHIQTYNDKTTNPKCPCCSLPIYINDLRPIQIIPIQTPATTSASLSKHPTNDTMTTTTTRMRFIKLHRYKYCHTSYIPHPTEPRRLSPNAIPCHTVDSDAIYSKFNYLHVPTYLQLLQTNLNDIRVSLEQQRRQNHNARRSMSMIEDMVFGLAMQSLQSELHHIPTTQTGTANYSSSPQYHNELQLQQQYMNSGSGFYSLQIPSLIHHHTHSHHDSDNHQATETELLFDSDHHNLDRTTALESISTSWDCNNDGNGGDDHDNHSNRRHHHHPNQQRDRGNSITSVQSCSTSNSMNSYHKQDFQQSIQEAETTTNGGSMYATNEECILYQAYDGSLCFLSGFNMNCLRTEYASTLPIINDSNIDCEMEQLSMHQLWDDDNSNHPDGSSRQSTTTPLKLQNNRPTRPPLPDTVEGSIVEIERLVLTPEMRERRRFLSHIPLYTEVCFVELDINHLLSSRTKNVFKKEFSKRQQGRLAREKAEQREDELLQRLEQEKINERKARIQQIDPMDDFFQPVVPMRDDATEPNMLSDDFGPSISSNAIASALTNDAVNTSTLPGISFSQACKSGEVFPNLLAAPTEMNFPALGSSPPNPKTNMIKKKVPPPPKSWSNTTVTTKTPPPNLVVPHDAVVAQSSLLESGSGAPTGKKTKNKKIVLFSTGAHRNDYF